MMAMRITTQMISNSFKSAIGRRLNDIARYQGEVSSGKKLMAPSDSPNGSVVALSIHSRIEKNNQYQRTIDDAEGRLGITENMLNDIRNLVVRSRDLALNASDLTVNADDRIHVAIEIDQMLEHLVSVANRESLDGYVFGGTKTDSQPFNVIRDSQNKISQVVPAGEITGNLLRQIDPGTPMEISTNLQGVLFGNQNLFETLVMLRDGLTSNRTDMIQESMGRLSNEIHEKVTGQISEVGSKMALLIDRSEELDNEFVQFSERLSEVEDADIVESIVQLNQSIVAYEAALQASNEVMRSTLLDLFR